LRSYIRFRQLPRADQKLVLRAAFFLTRSVVVLKLFGFKQCYRKTTAVTLTNPEAPSESQLHDAATAIRRASNGLGIGTCLSRSFALRELLHKQGVRTRFRIGVGKNGGELKAHAWLEYNDTPIGEDISDDYNVFAELN
jgi:hypothetical protein